MSKINCLLKKFSSNCPIFLYTFTFCKIIRQPVVRLWVIHLRPLNSVLVFNFVLRLKRNQRRSYARNSLHRRTMFISISNLLPLPLQPAQTLPCRLLRNGIAAASDDQRDDQDCFRFHPATLSNLQAFGVLVYFVYFVVQKDHPFLAAAWALAFSAAMRARIEFFARRQLWVIVR